MNSRLRKLVYDFNHARDRSIRDLSMEAGYDREIAPAAAIFMSEEDHSFRERYWETMGADEASVSKSPGDYWKGLYEDHFTRYREDKNGVSFIDIWRPKKDGARAVIARGTVPMDIVKALGSEMGVVLSAGEIRKNYPPVHFYDTLMAGYGRAFPQICLKSAEGIAAVYLFSSSPDYITGMLAAAVPVIAGETSLYFRGVPEERRASTFRKKGAVFGKKALKSVLDEAESKARDRQGAGNA